MGVLERVIVPEDVPDFEGVPDGVPERDGVIVPEAVGDLL